MLSPTSVYRSKPRAERALKEISRRKAERGASENQQGQEELNIFCVDNVQCLGVNIGRKLTWIINVETTVAKALGTYIRSHSYSKMRG
jgi:hypothetical protein